MVEWDGGQCKSTCCLYVEWGPIERVEDSEWKSHVPRYPSPFLFNTEFPIGDFFFLLAYAYPNCRSLIETLYEVVILSCVQNSFVRSPLHPTGVRPFQVPRRSEHPRTIIIASTTTNGTMRFRAPRIALTPALLMLIWLVPIGRLRATKLTALVKI